MYERLQTAAQLASAASERALRSSRRRPSRRRRATALPRSGARRWRRARRQRGRRRRGQRRRRRVPDVCDEDLQLWRRTRSTSRPTKTTADACSASTPTSFSRSSACCRRWCALYRQLMSDETSSRLLSRCTRSSCSASAARCRPPICRRCATTSTRRCSCSSLANGQLAIRKLSDDDEQIAPQYEQVDAEFGDYVNGRVSDAEQRPRRPRACIWRAIWAQRTAPDKPPARCQSARRARRSTTIGWCTQRAPRTSSAARASSRPTLCRRCASV
jgi:hypothetical protein